MNIVLLEPEKPDNTGNIGRTCVASGSILHLIEPLGFILSEKNIRHAGLDYWERLKYFKYINFVDFIYRNGLEDGIKIPENYIKNNTSIIEEAKDFYDKNIVDKKEEGKANNKIYFATTKGHKTYADVRYNEDDYIMFGKESAGIPEEILSINEENCIRIPMIENERSLNLANSVSIVLYEALRQQDFKNMNKMGDLHNLKYEK